MKHRTPARRVIDTCLSRSGMHFKELAEYLDVTDDTLRNHFKYGTLTIQELKDIRKVVRMSTEELVELLS